MTYTVVQITARQYTFTYVYAMINLSVALAITNLGFKFNKSSSPYMTIPGHTYCTQYALENAHSFYIQAAASNAQRQHLFQALPHTINA